MMVEQRFPPGWDADRVKALADYYDNQTDDEAIAEAEAALEEQGQTLVMVPTELMPAIRELIAKHQQQEEQPSQ
jgi:vacuolar-type H+-ATPase subunit F/Vma7